MCILPGIDVLLSQHLDRIVDRRIGLVSNASSVTRNLLPTAEVLLHSGHGHLTALFAPEHGFYASTAAATAVKPAVDARLGLPVYSLYGDVQRPVTAMLAGLDLLIFDLQSVGVRFYTYTTTLLYVLQAAAEHRLPVIVCDRPNPLAGEVVEGPVLEPAFASFVGCGPLPIRHGLTIGELARLYVERWGYDCDLMVAPCTGWQRAMWFDETGLLWLPPSPNMPKLSTAVLYPGTCLIEGTNLSEGRGTALPFEVVGAPGIDGWALAQAMNELNLPGIHFQPTRFEPAAGKWAGQLCHGLQLHVLDRRLLRPVAMALHLIATIKARYADIFTWHLPHFDRLLGTDLVRQQLEAEIPVSEIISSWNSAQATFMRQRESVLIY